MSTEETQSFLRRRSLDDGRLSMHSPSHPPPAFSSSSNDLTSPLPKPARPGAPPRRQSSLAKQRPDGNPRTSNRVRFDFAAASLSAAAPGGRRADGHGGGSPVDGPAADDGGDEQDRPLLTDVEAPGGRRPGDAFAIDDGGGGGEGDGRARSGLGDAFLNMANSIIGAGIIGQPFAFRQAGLVAGVVLLVGLTAVVDWTIRLIVVNSKLSGSSSFQATVEHCFGRPGLIAISLAQWAFAFGGMLAFCIIIGDCIPHVFIYLFPKLQDTPFLWLLTDRRAVIVIFVLGISYPLSLYRDIAKLAKASAFALVSMLVILTTVVTQGARLPASERGAVSGSYLINGGVTQAIGIISFAFVCHHNSLLIYGSLKQPTMDRFAKVTHYSTGISMLACLAMALAGFLTFGDRTQGNVLNNFPTDNLMVNVARLCFGLNMLTTLPLECFVCREVMVEYWYAGEPWRAGRHLALTTGLVVAAAALALVTCDLGAVFQLIGATSAAALAFIFPPACYLKLSTRTWRVWASAGGCALFGVAVMVTSLAQTLYQMSTGDGEGGSKCGA